MGLTGSEHWEFTREHNVETFRNISKCFLPTWHGDYRQCIAKPLILSGYRPTAEVLLGKTTRGQSQSTVLTSELMTRGDLAIGSR